MLRVGLTGGIATGKSTVLARFAAYGVPVIDADRLAHDAILPGTPGWDAVRARFGDAVVARDGTIDRPRLGARVFQHPGERAALEAIIHPRVIEAITRRLSELEAGGQALVVADVPLLFETGHDADFDRVIVVACDPEEQLRRVMARDGLSEESARARLNAQWPIAAKVERADHVIDTNGSLESTERQVAELYDRLRRRPA